MTKKINAQLNRRVVVLIVIALLCLSIFLIVNLISNNKNMRQSNLVDSKNEKPSPLPANSADYISTDAKQRIDFLRKEGLVEIGSTEEYEDFMLGLHYPEYPEYEGEIVDAKYSIHVFKKKELSWEGLGKLQLPSQLVAVYDFSVSPNKNVIVFGISTSASGCSSTEDCIHFAKILETEKKYTGVWLFNIATKKFTKIKPVFSNSSEVLYSFSWSQDSVVKFEYTIDRSEDNPGGLPQSFSYNVSSGVLLNNASQNN